MFRKIKVYMALCMILSMILTGCGSTEPELTTEPNTGTPEKATVTDAIEFLGGDVQDAMGFTRVDDYVKTNVAKVNVRIEPSTKSKVYMILVKGVFVQRTGYNDEWTRVRLNGKDYYIFSKYVSEAGVEWASENDAVRQNHIIYLDPAKQATANTESEPVGPGAQDRKKKASAGSVGVVTGAYEYDVTLLAAGYFKTELENRGYVVVLSRDSSEVNISNAERGKRASAFDADVYIRIQASGSDNPATEGFIGFTVTSESPYAKRNYRRSYNLCKDILLAMYTKTGTTLQGIQETDALSCLNWCDVPATAINIGFLTNEMDDTRLADEKYLKELSKSFADGVDDYFGIGD